MINRPKHIHLDRAKGLTVEWSDGSSSFYPVAYLRRMSPSADARELRDQMKRNPLTVLPAGAGGSGDQPMTVQHIEGVGNYAVRLMFSDGHHTGLYSWDYLRSIDPKKETSAQG